MLKLKTFERRKMLKALNSSTPKNAIYNAMSEKQKQELRRIAACFNFSKDDIDRILQQEKHDHG